MIIFFIVILYLINLLNNQQQTPEEYKCNEKFMKIIIIFTCFAATIKPYYLINFSLFLTFLYFRHTRNLFLKLFFSRTFIYCLFLITSISFFTFINSGCLVFPIMATCFENLSWSVEKDLIYQTKIWFELWSKGGANPNFIIDDRIEYISGLNWLTNWIDNYFFNKVLDFIFGISLLSLIIFSLFFHKKKSKYLINKKIIIVYSLIFLLFLEWFFKHPTLRYGGYHLIATMIFIPLSVVLSNFGKNYNFFIKRSIVVIFVVSIIFLTRNFLRLNNENLIYGYNPLQNPNYKFIGGDEKFYYRYNDFIKGNLQNFKTIEVIGKKIHIIKN